MDELKKINLKCRMCGKINNIESKDSFINLKTGNVICNYCGNELYRKCEVCGELGNIVRCFFEGDSYIDPLCPVCRTKSDSTLREFLEEIDHIT